MSTSAGFVYRPTNSTSEVPAEQDLRAPEPALGGGGQERSGVIRAS